ncbi:MAG: tRNA (adenosine(37)-N6)-threonylcarbamoyltransferase complex ATPase subunit type 1 TsaE [Enterococcaceae bacterium]|nr:tRNA (adenosine(37)-N6)-threonylcarbamoyltransferase complex ATPase subunit type 1 TsaE [Enterococcaceae bacterium]MCI1918536.1 tRNA (adenosine(37)-N6)-threonylcarbamoyltransferase complex ATPase subunit type 1 TsaE [Enterococcaceae bacterium]
MKFEMGDVFETQKIARLIARHLESGDVLLLVGDLGTGKTTFTQGLAEGLGIKRHLKSPTYTLIREYTEGRLPLYHMDVYRIDGEVEDMGLEEYFEGDGVSVVEWGDLLSEPPENAVTFSFTRGSGPDERQLVVSGPVEVVDRLLHGVKEDPPDSFTEE